MRTNNFIKMLKIVATCVCLVAVLSSCVTKVTGSGIRPIDLDKALELHIKLAQGYVDKGNRESARHHLRKAFDIDKKSAEATAVQAMLYQLEGEPKLAEESFKKAIKGKKNFTLARNNYGVYLYKYKRYEEALNQFELAAADLDFDGRAEALVNVGRASLQLGHTERATSAFEHAAVIDRNLSEAFIELADLNFQKQDYTSAKKHLDRYMSFGQLSPRSILLGIRLERIFGNKDKEASFLLLLKNRYPYSKEYLEYKQTMSN